MDISPLYGRVDDLWFPDGSIVIRAENTIFRVAKSVLAARSSVFRDMVAFPQTEDGDTEIIDGTPAVYLHDSAGDVEAFLRALFDSNYFMPAPDPVGLEVLLGILRLSHKYDVQYLHRRALAHLEAALYISGFTDLKDRATGHIQSPGGHRFFISDIYAVIKAATGVGALWLLPVAYYRASQYDYDAHMEIATSLGMEVYAQACIKAVITLSCTNTAIMRCWSRPLKTSPVCNLHSCAQARTVALDAYLCFVTTGLDTDPFRTGEVLTEGNRFEMCDACYAYRKQLHLSALEALWSSLPSIFSLPSWAELDNMASAARCGT